MSEKHASRFALALAIVVAAFALRPAPVGGASEGSVDFPPPLKAGVKFMLLGGDWELPWNTFVVNEVHGRWIQATATEAVGTAEAGVEYWLNVPAWRSVRILSEKPEAETGGPRRPR